MPLRLRDGYVNLITSASHLLLLLAAARINERPAWIVCGALVAVISFFAWMGNFRRGRAIANVPTSKIGSAARGYVEIYGRADGNHDLVSAKVGSLPCVWFRCRTFRKVEGMEPPSNNWRQIDYAVSDTLFEVADDSGRCMVDPDDAEVIATHRRTWREGDYKYVEDQLFNTDSIYVLGEFQTIGGAYGPLSASEDIAALLAEWKRDRVTLLKKFDLDGNGEIDMREWELARKAAAREVEKQHRELRQQPGVHVMRKPASGRLFLISNLSPQQLRRKYLLWGALHLGIFFVSLAALIRFGIVQGWT
ncbi:MAG: hypothetical protein LBE33_06440 [Zoogloeaceae bacterium]|jgi:hypothetical protein|nr:hypothetical protein [Zoogloeaceae bacterium]